MLALCGYQWGQGDLPAELPTGSSVTTRRWGTTKHHQALLWASLNHGLLSQTFPGTSFPYSTTDLPEWEHVQSTRWVCLNSFIKLLVNELQETQMSIFLMSLLERGWQQWKRLRALSVFTGKSVFVISEMEYALLFNVTVSNINHVWQNMTNYLQSLGFPVSNHHRPGGSFIPWVKT